MKKNRNGFTLIEMLGTIVLLGILGAIAITAVTKYLTQSKEKAYRMMSQSIYEAAMNCATESNCTFPGEYKVVDLQSKGYLDQLKNPYNKNGTCTGKVSVCEATDSDTEYKDYAYSVKLNCGSSHNEVINWPYGKNKSCKLTADSDDNTLVEDSSAYPETPGPAVSTWIDRGRISSNVSSFSNLKNSCNNGYVSSLTLNISFNLGSTSFVYGSTDLTGFKYYIGNGKVKGSGITADKSGEMGHSGYYSTLNLLINFNCSNYQSGRLYIIFPEKALRKTVDNESPQLVLNTNIDLP